MRVDCEGWLALPVVDDGGDVGGDDDDDDGCAGLSDCAGGDVVIRLEHTGLLVVVVTLAVGRLLPLLLQMVAACSALARLLIRCDVLPAGALAMLCGLPGDLVVKHLLVCNEEETWLPELVALGALLPIGTPLLPP